MPVPLYRFLRNLLKLLLVFALYLGAADAGLAVPFTSGNISPVWPASGVALASVLLWGYEVWPGIALGAFLANFLHSIPAPAAAGMALGNTSSALLGRYLLCRFVGFQLSLARVKDVLALVTLAATASPVVAASVGVTSLSIAHVQAWSGLGSAWRVWWLGDAMGVLIITPLFLKARELASSFKSSRLMELLPLCVGLLVTCLVIFGRRAGFGVRDDVLAFVVFPFVIWGAIRFRLAGAAIATALIASVALWGTAQARGPFVGHNPLHNVALLQLFIAVVAVTGLILAAVTTERKDMREAFETEKTLRNALQQAQSSLQEAHDRLEARVRERTAELERKATQVSEQAQLLDLANDAIFVRRLDDKVSYWNRGAERLYGWKKEEILGKTIQEILRTEFSEPLCDIKAQVLRDGNWQGELKHSRQDGTQITVVSRWSVWSDQQGKPLGFLELSTDITARKRAEESLRALSGRLLQLQDEERRRIARELHDSAGQVIAAIGMNVAAIQRESDQLSEPAAKACSETSRLVQELSKEIRTLSHLLHPPLLDEAGLPSALRWYVEGFSERSRIDVNLGLAPDLGRLSGEAETAIFRLVQECLTNIHRHSGSRTASIRIARNAREVEIEVRDQGKGISAKPEGSPPAHRRTGVGIQGMRERIAQLGGRFEIHSGKNGTVVRAALPAASVSAESSTQTAGFSS